MKKFNMFFAFACILFIYMISYLWMENKITQSPKSDRLDVHVINVGKADSIFISCKGKNVLIDAADKDVNDTVESYISRNAVQNLDLVIVTHPHRDHIGQMSSILKKFPVERFLMPKIKTDILPITFTYETLLKTLKLKNISPEVPVPGSCIEIEDMKLHILAPNAEYDKINNYSIVVKLEYGERKFLFTGDAEKESEEDMIKKGYDLKADVLKVGHHGSKSSSSQKFVDAVKPQYAVISTGPDKNQLPKKEIINRFTKNNIQVLRTDYDGDIIISTDGKDLKVIKGKGIT